MRQYLTQRLFYTLLLLVLISLFSFFVIQLPPGDFLSHYAAQLADLGDEVSERELEGLRRQYGLDQPIYVQYLKRIWETK
jgi:peptide/nickel transport system permease protein